MAATVTNSTGTRRARNAPSRALHPTVRVTSTTAETLTATRPTSSAAPCSPWAVTATG